MDIGEESRITFPGHAIGDIDQVSFKSAAEAPRATQTEIAAPAETKIKVIQSTRGRGPLQR